MMTLDRYAYRERYRESPSRIEKCPVGQSISINGNPVKVIDAVKDTYGFKNLVIEDAGEQITLDLAPHWERGPEGPIKTCHEGAVNLIKAIYAQTEKDYEQLYLCGEKGYNLERLPGESKAEYEARQKSLFSIEKKRCENILGEVFTKYAKVKALWKISKDVNYIAQKIGSTPYHVSCIVDRLGLNRTDSPKEDDDLF